MRKIKTLFRGMILALLFAGLWSCYPDNGLNSVGDYDVVVTTYNKEVDFSKIITYAMPDSVFEMEGSEERTTRYDPLVLQLVEKNLEDYGYTREMSPDTVNVNYDVIVLVRAIKTKNYTVSGGYWPGGGYYPGYPGYPGWGWYYPYYQVSTFVTGTYLIDMIYPDYNKEDLVGVWSAGLNGLVSSSAAGQENRITTRVNKAFEQSPYLNKNNQ